MLSAQCSSQHLSESLCSHSDSNFTPSQDCCLLAHYCTVLYFIVLYRNLMLKWHAFKSLQIDQKKLIWGAATLVHRAKIKGEKVHTPSLVLLQL